MRSKRYKKLPEKTRDLNPEPFQKLISEIKKIVLLNSMSQLIYVFK